MAEEATGATDTQAESGTQPPAGTSEAQAATESGAESSSPPESISLEEAKKLRSEANSLRKRLKEFEDKDKSESERTADRIKELEAQLDQERTGRRAMAVQVAAIAAARKLGFRDPDLAPRLVSATEVEFGDDGSPRNVERLLGDLAKDHPHLVGNGTTDYGGGPRGSAPSTADDMNYRIRRATGRV